MSRDFWDDPEFIKPDNDYVKWSDPGQTESGRINDITMREFDDGKKAPQITFVNAEGATRIMTASQVDLKARLAALRPIEGDSITVKYLGEQRLAGGRAMKTFEVEVDRNNDGETRRHFA